MAEENFKYINLDYIKSMAGDNEELIREMAEIFVSQIPEFNEIFDSFYENFFKDNRHDDRVLSCTHSIFANFDGLQHHG